MMAVHSCFRISWENISERKAACDSSPRREGGRDTAVENTDGQPEKIYMLAPLGQNNEVPLWSGYFKLFI